MMVLSQEQQDFLDYCRSLPADIDGQRHREDFKARDIPHLLGFITILTVEPDGSLSVTLAGSKTEAALNTYATGQNLLRSLLPREHKVLLQYHQTLFSWPCAGSNTVIGHARGSSVTAMHCISCPFVASGRNGASKPIIITYSRFDNVHTVISGDINTRIGLDTMQARQFQDYNFHDIGFGTPKNLSFLEEYQSRIEPVTAAFG
ncbi:hypothetical protein [Kordiimonas sp. SCSIO 12610]|uniref:hypothetical protein n=1 Tax=Kordiimonas sp. SCSIO 12610 TaxID=2829597 RepID=UPI00210A65B2|nr:hypothetical protein [Kordiimonas sp. SCSIO 12610]UTW55653.1 hypothetical protein KFF44_01790 [Kordiimonas sp. SCSIO 12610]